MKIKTKLTLLFTLIIAVLLIVINLNIYSVSKSYASKDFFNWLSQRAYSAANLFLEKDEVSKTVFQKFQKSYTEKLSNEIVEIYNSKNQSVFTEDSARMLFPTSVIEKARKEKTYKSHRNEFYVYGMFYKDNQGDFVILVSAIDKIGFAKLKQLRNDLVIEFFISIVIVFFLGMFFIKKTLKPISNIIVQVNKITDTNLHMRLNEGNGKDELAHLAITFNNMLTRIEDAFELQQNFVSNASHELRTPLTSIIGNIDVTLSKQRSPEEYKSALKTILEEAERLHKLSDGLLNIAQASSNINSLKIEDIRIDELLEEVKDVIQNQMPESKMEFHFENLPENFDNLIIKGNKNLLRIAFENLFENANKFSENKKVTITLLVNA